MIGDQQERTAVFHPVAHCVALFIGKRGTVRAFVIHFLSTQGVGDHQHFESIEG